MPWDGLTHPAFKFGEVTTYTLDMPLYVSNFTHGISRDTYNSLSDAQKKAIDSVCTPEWSRLVYKHWYEDGIKREDDVRKSDRKLTKLGPTELKLWREAAKPVYDAWADAVKKAGYDPAQVLKELQGRAQEGRRAVRRCCRLVSRNDTALAGLIANGGRHLPPRTPRESFRRHRRKVGGVLSSVRSRSSHSCEAVLRYGFNTHIPDGFVIGQTMQGIAICWGIATATYADRQITVDILYEIVGQSGAPWFRRDRPHNQLSFPRAVRHTR